MPGTCVSTIRKCFPDQVHTPQPLLVGTCPQLPLQRLGLKAAPVQTWSCCCPLVVEWDTTSTRDGLATPTFSPSPVEPSLGCSGNLLAH